jgi:probable HAF family extracellular repeat protein
MLRRLLVRAIAAVWLVTASLLPIDARAGLPGFPCFAGSSSPTGFQPCTSCAPGTFASFPGMNHCDACPADSFADEFGATGCLPCGCNDGLVCTIDACEASSGSCSNAHDTSCRARFQPLGQLPDGVWSVANDVSSDGTVVVGWSMVDSDQHAYRWTSEEGMVALGDLPGGDDFSEAYAVSADGSVVVGSSDGDITAPGGSQAFEWTNATGMLGIAGATPTGASSALGLSDDGSTIVGWHYFTSNFSAFRATTTMQAVPGLTVAMDASADGFFVVGYDSAQAKRWSSIATDELGRLGTDNHSEATAVTPDGQTVVGWSYKTSSSFESSEPFRWTPLGGLVGLGHRNDRVNRAIDVSDSGALIVGTIDSGGTTDHRAFRWTEQEGVRTIQDWLEADYGLTLSGWLLSAATGVSADGATIVGNGSGPNGEEAWKITVPEPDSAIPTFAVVAALAIAMRAMRSRRR